MFKSIDTDNSGTVTFEELKAGLPKLGTKLSESEVRQLMEAVFYLFISRYPSGCFKYIVGCFKLYCFISYLHMWYILVAQH